MRVGYLLAEKKAQALGLLDCVKQKLNQLNIEVVNIDDRLSIESQGPFHMIIHKISDYQREADDQGDIIASRIIEEMYKYQKKHASTCVFIDSIEMVFQLANRATMSGICEKSSFQLGEYKVYVPPWIEINHPNPNSNNNQQQIITDDVINSLSSKGVTYPILCKALNAAEGPGAHDMQLIFNEYQLINELKIVPCIAQSFVNHDMNMCKIFVVGTSWCIVNRPSIRNFKDDHNLEMHYFSSSSSPSANKGGGASSSIDKPSINGVVVHESNSNSHNNSSQKTIVFNSHEVSKPDSVSFLNKFAKRYQQHVSYGNNELLNDQVVNELISRLQRVIPFTLMGIDIIVNGYNYGLIDINFLPGYDGMSNFHEEFFKLILSKLNVNPHKRPHYSNGVHSSKLSTTLNHIKN